MAVGNAPLPFGIMLGLASYLVASRLPRRVSIPAAAASAAALGGALVYAALTARNASVAVEAVEGFLPLVGGLVHRRQRRGAPALPGRAGRTGRAGASRRGRTRPPAGPRGTGAHRPRTARRRGPHPRGDHRPGRGRPASHGQAPGGGQHRPGVHRDHRPNGPGRTAGRPRAAARRRATERPPWPRPRGSSTSRTWSKRSRPRAPRSTCACPGPIARSRRRSSCRSTASSRRRSPTSSSTRRAPAPRSTWPCAAARSASTSPTTAGCRAARPTTAGHPG